MELIASEKKVVTIDYTLTDDKGTVLDSSKGARPLEYIHGIGNIIPGLERAIEGKKKDDNVKVVVSPEEAYGVFREEMVQTLPKENFESEGEIEVGMQFHADTEQGPIVLKITKIEGNDVTVDGNHPLAGMTLSFDVTVLGVREATENELKHGHVHCDSHGHGGCGSCDHE